MEKLANLKKNDPKMDSMEAFQALIFSYSCESMYGAINWHLFQARYTKLQNYMKNLLRLNEKFGSDISYKKYHEPVYRGMGFGRFAMRDYPPNTIQ